MSSGTVQKDSTQARMDLSGRCRIVQFVQLVWHSDNQVTGAPVGYVGPREAKQSPLLLDMLVQGRVAMQETSAALSDVEGNRCKVHSGNDGSMICFRYCGN